MKTIKQLANIGAKAAVLRNKGCGTLAVTRNHPGWHHDEDQRQAFAQAVRDAVLADLVTKTDSSPVTKTVPLTLDDIRATDEFRHCSEVHQLMTVLFADETEVIIRMHTLSVNLTYKDLADHYLRRQHGSNEWKPCTKETK